MVFWWGRPMASQTVVGCFLSSTNWNSTLEVASFHNWYLSFFLHGQNFWRIKFTPKNSVNYDKIHSKLQIFRVKSVKIYTGQKKFTKYIWRSWQIWGMSNIHKRTIELLLTCPDENGPTRGVITTLRVVSEWASSTCAVSLIIHPLLSQPLPYAGPDQSPALSEGHRK